MNIGRKRIIDEAINHASEGKNIQQRFDSFLTGVDFILKALDGKTIVMDTNKNDGSYIKAGTVTKSFSWSMRNVQYSNSKYLLHYLELEALGSLEVKFYNTDEAFSFQRLLLNRFSEYDISTKTSKDKLTVTATLKKELV